jgi:hypothetical protein
LSGCGDSEDITGSKMAFRATFDAWLAWAIRQNAPIISRDLVGAPTKFVKSSPHLNGLFGRKPGGLSDFKKYSEALVAFGKDRVWNEVTLTTFLRDPQGVVKDTKMAFLGIREDDGLQTQGF